MEEGVRVDIVTGLLFSIDHLKRRMCGWSLSSNLESRHARVKVYSLVV